MSGICDTCKREHCHTRMDCVFKCDFYVGGETRYDRLFGTPERAARTLEKHCDGYHCIICPAHHHGCNDGDYDALLEWLRGDA